MARWHPRQIVALALLALIPVFVFTISQDLIVVLSALCVVTIAASLYYMFSPTQSPDDVSTTP